jgi:hypothetical protein
MAEKEPKETDLEHELEILYLRSADPHLLEGMGDTAPLPVYPGHGEHSSPTETAEPLPGRYEKRPFISTRVVLSAVILFVTAGLAALFFWPTIYHYNAFHSDGKVYLVRVNRLMGNTSFFDGKVWSSSPPPASSKHPVPQFPPPQPAAESPPATQNDAQNVDAATAFVQDKMQIKLGYGIQVKAFPEGKKNDALLFLEDVQQRWPDVRLKTVRIPGRGVWHRVLLGNFNSMEDAASHMREHKVSGLYPDSFIQKSPAAATSTP